MGINMYTKDDVKDVLGEIEAETTDIHSTTEEPNLVISEVTFGGKTYVSDEVVWEYYSIHGGGIIEPIIQTFINGDDLLLLTQSDSLELEYLLRPIDKQVLIDVLKNKIKLEELYKSDEYNLITFDGKWQPKKVEYFTRDTIPGDYIERDGYLSGTHLEGVRKYLNKHNC